jgi:solute carrier family 8 (sodium/calcium exchanger)
MALGSSAPEILLSIIEIFGNHFEAGDLGPNTIVGSAAYNLFVIIGYCILVVPTNEVRRIKHLRVFFVTATWSIFAYIWLYLILSVISVGEVELWESFLTFLFFPLTVLTAYMVDKKIFLGNFLEKKFKSGKLVNGNIDEESAGAVDLPLNNKEKQQLKQLTLTRNDDLEGGQFAVGGNLQIIQQSNQSQQAYFEEHRRDYMNILRELRQKHPDISIDELQKLAEIEILKRGPKSRAYYRIQATRKLIGGGTTNVKKKLIEKEKSMNELRMSKSKSQIDNLLSNENNDDDPNKLTSVYFEPAHYTCFESVGSLELYVCRSGGDLNQTILVDYKTENGSAEANSDFVYTEGTLIFYPNETRKHFVVKIIDDDVYEEDEHFYARILNARYKNNQIENENEVINEKTLRVVYPDLATIMILDDDHCGVFVFAETKMEIIENCGTLRIKVIRTSGARGKVKVSYKTIDGTALGGKDFEKKDGVLTFYNNEIE